MAQRGSNDVERRTAADERDRIADERDVVADAREAAWGDRERQLDAIFAAAALRDDWASIRDFQADRRDRAANLNAFINDVDDDPAFQTRELAKADRLSARADRIAAEVDRYVLSDLSPTHQEREEALERRAEAAVERMHAANGSPDADLARRRYEHMTRQEEIHNRAV
jgi:hypothetical protein